MVEGVASITQDRPRTRRQPAGTGGGKESMMHLMGLLLLGWVLWGLFAPGCGFCAETRTAPPKKAILLVAFGTTVSEAQKAYDQVEARVREAFPQVEARWAYTSKTVRAKLAKEGRRMDSPESALARLMEDGYTHVAVLSLHVIPGEEFHDLYQNAMCFREMAGGFKRITVASPLLSSHEDMDRVAHALLKQIPAARKPEEAVLFMGHGTKKHPSDAAYAAMNFVLQDMSPNVFVATVEGYPSLDDLIGKLIERKIGRAYLIPFMAVAGRHALDDMAGPEPESWKSTLGRNGIACEPILTGVAEYPEVVDVWMDHLREALSALGE